MDNKNYLNPFFPRAPPKGDCQVEGQFFYLIKYFVVFQIDYCSHEIH